MTSAERQKAFRERMRAQGFEQVTVWVPSSQASDLSVCCKRLCEDAELELGPLRNTVTGKLVRKPV